MKKKLKKLMVLCLIMALTVTSTETMLTVKAEISQTTKKTELNKNAKNVMDSNDKKTDSKKIISEEKKLKKSDIVKKGTNYDIYKKNGENYIKLYFEDIRFKGKDNKLKDYDPSLIKNEKEINPLPITNRNRKKSQIKNAEKYAYTNAKGDSSQYIPKIIDEETPLMLEKDDYAISFMPTEELDKLELVEGKAMYGSKAEDTSYIYTSLNNGLKEDVVFENVPKSNVVVYKYALDGMYMKLDKKTNQISLYDTGSNEKVAYISTPFMKDATEKQTCFDIKIDISNAGNIWTVKMELDKSYLNDKKTVYPVTLDPIVLWSGASSGADIQAAASVSYDKYKIVDATYSTYQLGEFGSAGSRLYMKFPNLRTLIKGKYINMCYLNMNVQSKYGTPSISVYPVMADWSPWTIWWANQPDINYGECVCNVNTFSDESSSDFIITDWTKKLASGEIDNDYGLAFTHNSDGVNYLNMYGIAYSGKAAFMYIWYDDAENIGASYDGTFNTNGIYNEESQNIELTWDEYKRDNIDFYDIYMRMGNKFELVGSTEGNKYNIPTNQMGANTDFRVMAVNQKTPESSYSDINYLSNIITFQKSTNTVTDENGNETGESTFDITTVDTDGDGLEDGYEIWDFKTLWNTETGVDEEGNKIYDLDTDKDGFPDSYEVFTLGTNPAVKNEEGKDSDGDGWTDLKEYQEGTDPYLKDSDFDGTNDRGDDTPRKTNDYTRQTRASEATVHVGLYDRQYSETTDGVTYTYITNIYRGDIKQIFADYGDISLNKVLKKFYDKKGNNTALVEAYDEAYDPSHTQTICITYTYDENNNVTFICDQRTKYTMSYGIDGKMTGLKVGNHSLITYENSELLNNIGSDVDISSIQTGGIIDKNEYVETYGNGQTVKTVTTTYKVDDEDTDSISLTKETYYNNDEAPTYVTYFNSDGEIIKLEDYSIDLNNIVEWNYSYTEKGTSVVRSDGFTKSVQTSYDQDTGNSTIVTSYGFKDLKNINRTYSSTITSQVETETDEEGTKRAKDVVNQTLHNNDVVNIKSDDNSFIEKIHSDVYNTDVIKNTYAKDENIHSIYDVDIYGNTDDKSYDYFNDLAGNIIQIKLNGVVQYEYGYDANGRLTTEKDYTIFKEYCYDYNTNGNVYGKTEYPINSNGSRTEENGKTIHYIYGNSNWPDQLTSYNEETITYDNSGNPLMYVGGLSFTWSRGRNLSKITFEDESNVSYKYNENGLRIFKDTSDATTVFEWDGNTLIREIITYKKTNQKADIWYLYDAHGKGIGFEYSYFNFTGTLSTARVYYEKNFQEDVIGLLDSRGAQIAAYTYDAWGNVISSSCVEGNEIPYELNHIMYRGYYIDNETGFYYLKSRYYDSEVGRFINADDIKYLDMAENTVSKNNLYVYCNSNPINNIDPEGNLIIPIQSRVSWKKSNKKRKNDYFTIALSGWYKASEFETITLNKGYSVSASVSTGLGVSAKSVSANVGLSSSYTISSTASGTHRVKKKRGKYVRFVGKVDAYVWDVKKTTTTYACYFIKLWSSSKNGKLYIPIKNTLSVDVQYSDKKY